MEPARYIVSVNGIPVAADAIHTTGRQGTEPNWLCRSCGLGFVRLKVAKAHSARAH